MNSPPEIAKEYLEFAKKQVRLTLPKLIILSIYAGFFISSGAICSLACSYRLTGGDGRFYAGLVGPIGLMLCLCAGAELFTANCLLVIPVFCRQISIIDMLINWGITFLGNFVGGMLMAVLIVYGHVTHLFDYALASYLVTEGIEKTSLSFGDAFVKGILGNFCLCLSIWLSFGAKDLFSKIAALWTPFALLRACGYEHIVSNMFYIPAALMAASEYNLVKDNLSWGRYFYKNLIPVLLGNIIGGGGFCFCCGFFSNCRFHRFFRFHRFHWFRRDISNLPTIQISNNHITNIAIIINIINHRYRPPLKR